MRCIAVPVNLHTSPGLRNSKVELSGSFGNEVGSPQLQSPLFRAHALSEGVAVNNHLSPKRENYTYIGLGWDLYNRPEGNLWWI